MSAMFHLPVVSVYRLSRVLLATVAIVVLLVAVAHADISNAIDATCRITTPDGCRGTGCVFEISNGEVYVLTAGHVVGKNSAVRCEFWRDGHQSIPLTAQVLKSIEQPQVDAAILGLHVEQFGGYLPAVIPIAPRDTILPAGTTLASVGCANGSWETAWKGHVLGYEGTDVAFVPSPADGRSGSALFDAEGRYIVGIVRARTMDGNRGIASGLQAIYAGLGDTEQKTQCGPGGCATVPPMPQPQQPIVTWPTLPQASIVSNHESILPYRREQAETDRQLAAGIRALQQQIADLGSAVRNQPTDPTTAAQLQQLQQQLAQMQTQQQAQQPSQQEQPHGTKLDQKMDEILHRLPQNTLVEKQEAMLESADPFKRATGLASVNLIIIGLLVIVAFVIHKIYTTAHAHKMAIEAGLAKVPGVGAGLAAGFDKLDTFNTTIDQKLADVKAHVTQQVKQAQSNENS